MPTKYRDSDPLLGGVLYAGGGGRDSTPVRGVPYEPAIIRLRGALAELRLSRFDSESWCWVCSQLFDRFAAFLRPRDRGGSNDDDDKPHETEALSNRIKG
jgi:hypothetical protein